MQRPKIQSDIRTGKHGHGERQLATKGGAQAAAAGVTVRSQKAGFPHRDFAGTHPSRANARADGSHARCTRSTGHLRMGAHERQHTTHGQTTTHTCTIIHTWKHEAIDILILCHEQKSGTCPMRLRAQHGRRLQLPSDHRCGCMPLNNRIRDGHLPDATAGATWAASRLPSNHRWGCMSPNNRIRDGVWNRDAIQVSTPSSSLASQAYLGNEWIEYGRATLCQTFADFFALISL